jgi:hypothetical protein
MEWISAAKVRCDALLKFKNPGYSKAEGLYELSGPKADRARWLRA